MNTYTKRQYYVREIFYHNYSLGWGVFRDGNHITKFEKILEADVYAEKLNKHIGDIEAYELLNNIRNEITLYEDGELSSTSILESIKGMLDNASKKIEKL